MDASELVGCCEYPLQQRQNRQELTYITFLAGIGSLDQAQLKSRLSDANNRFKNTIFL
jgi:hypothetical protein